MIICRKCKVELEPGMQVCPLCNEPVDPHRRTKEESSPQKGKMSRFDFKARTMSKPQKKAVWELLSIILILLVVATGLIDFIINNKISWSEYPIAICLMIFSYVSFFSFVNKSRGVQLLLAFVTSSALLWLLDLFTDSRSWTVQLGIPLLFILTGIVTGLLLVFHYARQKGINLIAYSFLAIALLCLSVESVIDYFKNSQIDLFWSLIVCVCVLPVATVLLFMHHRLKKGRDLNKTFHV